MDRKQPRSQGLNLCRIDVKPNLEHIWENWHDKAKEEDICGDLPKRGASAVRKKSGKSRHFCGLYGLHTAEESHENRHHDECL
jgi:hypothetical protein